MNVAFQENPIGNVKPRLEGSLKEYTDKTNEFINAINNRIIQPESPVIKLPEFVGFGEDASTANSHLYDLTIKELDTLLNARISGFSHKKYGILSVVTIIIILTILFAFLSIGSIKDSIAFTVTSQVLTPVRLLAYLIAAIFTAEFSIMLILHYLIPPLPAAVEGFVDSFLLIAVVSPFLYVFAFRPMLFSIREHEISEKALKESDKKLQHYTAELERSNRELQDFAYISSHDLQEPLRKVIAFGDRLKMKYSEILGGDGLDYLDRMNNATGRMQALINDLLAYSRVTTKAKPFKPTNLKEVVSQIVVDLENRISQTGGRVEIGDMPIIDADKTQMFQLFQNLIANALKFHKTGEAPVVTVKSRLIPPHPPLEKGETKVTPPLEKGGILLSPPLKKGDEGGFYEIIVEDNGIGFDEKHLDRIFKPFERLHGRKEYEGTGMGLPICSKIVKRHGGDITAKSSPNKGSAFIVTLPERQKRD
jgi:signal transduction histidine kinase